VTSTEERAPETRFAARVLLVDAADRVLLYRGFDPANPDVRYWFTVGGGLDDGESSAEAASRELAEEAGLVVPPRDLGDPVFANVTEFSFAGRQFRQQQDFYLYRIEHWDVTTDGFDQWERDTIDDHRWWTLAELDATPEPVYPEGLGSILRQLLDA
jgi:8-oxo-dGTP pyrophosphatase MutT (NUDIX family)